MDKKYIIFLTILTISIIAIITFGIQHKENENEAAGEMKIKSVFENNQPIPAKYTSDGKNVNPPLEISNIPNNAKSLVLIIDDPDAPRGDWVHWVLWNIPINLPNSLDSQNSGRTENNDIKLNNSKNGDYFLYNKIEEDSIPKGAVQGLNDFNEHKYLGPSPPSGTHRYKFKIYALDTTLNLNNNSRKSDVENAMQGHIIEQAVLTGTYSRG